MEKLKFKILKYLYEYKYKSEVKDEVNRIKRELRKGKIVGTMARKNVNCPLSIFIGMELYEVNRGKFIKDVLKYFSDETIYVIDDFNYSKPRVYLKIGENNE